MKRNSAVILPVCCLRLGSLAAWDCFCGIWKALSICCRWCFCWACSCWQLWLFGFICVKRRERGCSVPEGRLPVRHSLSVRCSFSEEYKHAGQDFENAGGCRWICVRAGTVRKAWGIPDSGVAVSYTHLDVYKRQALSWQKCWGCISWIPTW